MKLSYSVSLFPVVTIFLAFSARAQTIVEDQQLYFGTIVVADTSSDHDLELLPNGGYNADPGIYVINDPEVGEYTMTGATPSSNWTISFNAGNPLQLQSGANSDFIVDDFTTLPAMLQTDGSGEMSFSVGATLTSQNGGSYNSNNYSGNLQIILTEDN